MLSRVKALKKLPQLEELKKPEVHSKRRKKPSLKRSGITIDFKECKHAIFLPNEVYCGMLKEKVNKALCASCLYFDPEPVEYKLFRRT